jgi:hypothetical protein
MRPEIRRRTLTLAASTWGIAVLAGMLAMTRYEFTPGAAAAAPGAWPEGTGIRRTAGRYTLVLAMHAFCPCSRASYGELERIMARCGERVESKVLFYKPASSGGSWTAPPGVPGLSVEEDPDGREAARFGAFTSGQAVLYEPGGRMVFHGGLTAGRGVAGPNEGAEAVVEEILTGRSRRRSAPVFGCSLRSEGFGSAAAK